MERNWFIFQIDINFNSNVNKMLVVVTTKNK